MQSIRNSLVVALAAASILALPACDTDDSSPYTESLGSWTDDAGRMSFREVIDNSEKNNSFVLNNFRLNNFRLNNFRLNNFRLNSLALGAALLKNPVMNGNKLAAEDPEGEQPEGADLEDLRVFVDHEDPVTHEVTDFEIAQIEVEELAEGLVLQTVQHRVLPNGAWKNACENNAKAVLLNGEWDPDTGDLISTAADRTTWGCAGAALGDCAIWGYIPGKSHNGTPLINHHKACTRMKRGDYCGNGTPHTENGHSIDVYDSLGIMNPTPDLGWGIEALWGPSGAICLNFTRKRDYSKNSSDPGYIGCEIPNCVDINNDGVIDFADYPTARIATRTVPTWKTGT